MIFGSIFFKNKLKGEYYKSSVLLSDIWITNVLSLIIKRKGSFPKIYVSQ